MPYYLKIDNTIIAHAGVRPNIPLDKQTNDLMHIRYLTNKNEFDIQASTLILHCK